MKICNKCGVAQPYENFYKSPGMRDGRRGDSKECKLKAKQRAVHSGPGCCDSSGEALAAGQRRQGERKPATPAIDAGSQASGARCTYAQVRHDD